MMFLANLASVGTKKAAAAAVISCEVATNNRAIVNIALARYGKSDPQLQVVSNRQTVNATTEEASSNVEITNLGVEDESGTTVGVLGAIANSFSAQFDLDRATAELVGTTAIARWAGLPADASSKEVTEAVKQSLNRELDEQTVNKIGDRQLLATLAGLSRENLANLGLTKAEINAANLTIAPQAEGSFREQILQATQTLGDRLEPLTQARLEEFQTQAEVELANIRQQDSLLPAESIVNFKFRLNNSGSRVASVKLPDLEEIADGVTGTAQVIDVTYTAPQAEPQSISDFDRALTIESKSSAELSVRLRVGETDNNKLATIGLDLQSSCGDRNQRQILSLLPPITPTSGNPELIDPRGKISGCAGELLPDYRGFSVGLYDLDADDPTQSEIGSLTPLTTTELPDRPDNDIPPGIEPNIENSNPFFLTNEDEGLYSFLFDDAREQLDSGRNYILVVDPGPDSTYERRQVKLTIGDRQGRIVEYTATSLDGKPISAASGETTITGQIVLVEDAERIGLNLAVLDLEANICDAQEISITKTGDRATAEPGDIILYRLAIQNLSTTPIENLQISDTLPAGFALEADSVLAETDATAIEIETTSSNERMVNFTTNTTLEPEQTLNLVYAAEVSPDARRGSAENSAIVNARRTDNNLTVKAGPAIYRLQLESGIIRDAGTLIGRVFVDKNFDGEQQVGEPGVPNAVIYLDNGNRIITDPEGLFSVSNVLPGYHTGTLDLTTIPEYGLAPNLRFSEQNSSSRLVQLEPGGLVRMNFAVTPTATGEETTTAPAQDNSDE